MGSGQRGGYVYNAVRHHRSTAVARGIKLNGKSQKRSMRKRRTKKRSHKKGTKTRRRGMRKRYTKRR